jgi:hypothetical protein
VSRKWTLFVLTGKESAMNKRYLFILALFVLLPLGSVSGQTATPTDTPTNTPTNTPTSTPTVAATPIGAEQAHTSFQKVKQDLVIVNEVNVGIDSGSSDAYAATIPGLTIRHGTVVYLYANTANTGACSLAINSGTAYSIVTAGGDNPANDYIEADSFCQVIFNAQKNWWQLISPDANP